MKDGEKADRLGTLQPKEHHHGELLGFCFASYIPDLELKKPETQKCQQVQTIKALNKTKAWSVAKEPEKWQPNKTENF